MSDIFGAISIFSEGCFYFGFYFSLKSRSMRPYTSPWWIDSLKIKPAGSLFQASEYIVIGFGMSFCILEAINLHVGLVRAIILAQSSKAELSRSMNSC